MFTMKNKYIVEFLGAFTLSFVVLAAVAADPETLAVAIPVAAALTLGLFVYTIGSISGSHINPAVTIGLWTVKKIETKDAALYVVAQIFGAAVAIAIAQVLMITLPQAASTTFVVSEFIAEALGAFFFAFGIAAVVYGKVASDMSGVVVGGSLLLGILIASLGGAAGILNPAVAFALNSVTMVYVLAPVLGAVLGFQAYRWLTLK
jgi:glycerol uptake facilitator-like aquaporin